MALHRFAQSLLDPIDDVALRLERFALGMQLNVGLLELGDGDAYLLLHRRQSLRGRPRLDSGDLDRPLELRDTNRIAGALTVERGLCLGEFLLQIRDGARMLGVQRTG